MALSVQPTLTENVSIEESVAQLDALRRNPFEQIAVIFGTIAPVAGRHDVAWSRLPATANRFNVVPGGGRPNFAVCTHPVKLFEDRNLRVGGYRRDVAPASVNSRSYSEAKPLALAVPLAPLFVSVWPTNATVNVGDGKPRRAATAPRGAASAHEPRLGFGRLSGGPFGAAASALSVSTVAPRSIATKQVSADPLATRVAPLLTAGDVRLVFLNRNPEAFGGALPSAVNVPSHRSNYTVAGRLLDGRTWDEFPKVNS